MADTLGKSQSWNSDFLTADNHDDAGVNPDADADADAGVGHAVSLTFSRGVNILQS